jgi:hypothetical protein
MGSNISSDLPSQICSFRLFGFFSPDLSCGNIMLFDFVMHLVIFSMNALWLRNFEIFGSVVSVVKVCLSAGDFGKLCQLFFCKLLCSCFRITVLYFILFTYGNVLCSFWKRPGVVIESKERFWVEMILLSLCV